MGTVASQITSLTFGYTTVYSDGDQSKHQSSALLAFVWGIHPGEFPAQMASNAENVSIWWRHHDTHLWRERLTIATLSWIFRISSRNSSVCKNIAARVFNLMEYDNTISAVVTLHWLPVKYRIEFETLLMVFKGFNGKLRSYIQEMITPSKSKRYSMRQLKYVPWGSQCVGFWHWIMWQNRGAQAKLKDQPVSSYSIMSLGLRSNM